VGPSALCGWAGRPDGQVMFVVQDLTIGTGSRAAQARFANLFHGNWLAETSQVACEGGAEGLLRVGPAGPVAAKLVRARFLGPVYRSDVMTVGLRWEAAGAAGTLFPVLDANISISPCGGRNGPADAGGLLPATAGPSGGRARPGHHAQGGDGHDALPAAKRGRGARQPCPGRAPR